MEPDGEAKPEIVRQKRASKIIFQEQKFLVSRAGI